MTISQSNCTSRYFSTVKIAGQSGNTTFFQNLTFQYAMNALTDALPSSLSRGPYSLTTDSTPSETQCKFPFGFFPCALKATLPTRHDTLPSPALCTSKMLSTSCVASRPTGCSRERPLKPGSAASASPSRKSSYSRKRMLDSGTSRPPAEEFFGLKGAHTAQQERNTFRIQKGGTAVLLAEAFPSLKVGNTIQQERNTFIISSRGILGLLQQPSSGLRALILHGKKGKPSQQDATF